MNVKLIDRTGLRAAAIAAKTCIGRADAGKADERRRRPDLPQGR